MAAPNQGKLLNFVAKVWDEKARDYRPIYIAPDATETIQGDVYLSDKIDDESKTASAGMTAATPKAVALVKKNADTKLSKTDTLLQTVKGPVAFEQKITATGGVKGNVEGNLIGTADKAKALATPRKIAVKSGTVSEGSAVFSGLGDITITLPKLDATTLQNLVPIECIPQGAVERLVKVANKAARFKLTTGTVQLGDSVLEIDTGVMYIVVDEAKLNNEEGYQEYKAGTAIKANEVPWAGVTGKQNVSDSTPGLMTPAQKQKLDAIAPGAEVNQNAFSTITVNKTPIVADSKTDTLFINSGNNVQLNSTPENDTIVISATDTTYNVFTKDVAGLVPAPKEITANTFLASDGTFKVVQTEFSWLPC